MCKLISWFCLFLAYSVGVHASLPFVSSQRKYEMSDLVFVGQLLRIESRPGDKAAVLKSIFTIKGEKTELVVVCDDTREEGLVLRGDIGGTNVYFLRKNDKCYVGAFGYDSIAYLKDSCVFTGLVYQGEVSVARFEPLEKFVFEMTG